MGGPLASPRDSDVHRNGDALASTRVHVSRAVAVLGGRNLRIGRSGPDQRSDVESTQRWITSHQQRTPYRILGQPRTKHRSESRAECLLHCINSDLDHAGG